jgi:two-component system LytT family response regulator
MEQKNNLLPDEIFEVKTENGIKVAKTSHILYIKAERKFSVIYSDDGTNLIVFHMLGWFETFLCPPCFFRSHNSYLINCFHVSSVDHSSIIMTGKSRVPISRKRMDNFRENLRLFNIKSS